MIGERIELWHKEEYHYPAAHGFIPIMVSYIVFVLEYTVNPLDEAPLKLQPLKDISRAMRMIRFRAEQLHILSDQIVVCGFSAGGHLCASLCVHGADMKNIRSFQTVRMRQCCLIR